MAKNKSYTQNYIIECFSRNIILLRKSKKLSQEAFGKLFCVDRGAINSYEHGKCMAPVSIILQLAEMFDIGIKELLTTEIEL